MVWLSGLLPFEQAAQVFERIGHQWIAGSTLWDQSAIHAERFKDYLDRRCDRVGPKRVVLPPPGKDHPEPKGISLDGGMVNVRDEGWKVIRVGECSKCESSWNEIQSA